MNFAQVLGPTGELAMAVVSAYVLRVDWVLAQFPRDVPVVLLMPRAAGDKAKDVSVLDAAIRPNTFRIIPPERPLGSWAGCMHTKALVVSFSAR